MKGVIEAVEEAAGLHPGSVDPDAVEIVAEEGDISWVVVALPDGRWAATDDAEVAPDRVQVFPTRCAAVQAQWADWLLTYPDYWPTQATGRFGWRAEIP